MREILFRGKRVDNGEWVYGFYSKFDWVMSRTREHVETRHYILPQREQDSHAVIPDTVGQFTGLTDKNGVKIFEGDILNLWRGVGANGQLRGGYAYPLPVEYSDLWCQFVAYDKANKMQFCMWGEFGAYEVIGNLTDNPELLEVQG